MPEAKPRADIEGLRYYITDTHQDTMVYIIYIICYTMVYITHMVYKDDSYTLSFTKYINVRSTEEGNGLLTWYSLEATYQKKMTDYSKYIYYQTDLHVCYNHTTVMIIPN